MYKLIVQATVYYNTNSKCNYLFINAIKIICLNARKLFLAACLNEGSVTANDEHFLDFVLCATLRAVRAARKV